MMRIKKDENKERQEYRKTGTKKDGSKEGREKERWK
jgi:hypothetical protein